MGSADGYGLVQRQRSEHSAEAVAVAVVVAVVVVAAAASVVVASVGMTVAVVASEAADTASGTTDHRDAEGHHYYCNWHIDPRLVTGSDRRACS